MDSKFQRMLWGKNKPTKANKFSWLTAIFVGFASLIQPFLNSSVQGVIVFGGLGLLTFGYFWERKTKTS